MSKKIEHMSSNTSWLASITEYHNRDGIANRESNNIMDLKQKAQAYVAKMKRHTIGCGVLVESPKMHIMRM
jgi:hypothetical protein